MKVVLNFVDSLRVWVLYPDGNKLGLLNHHHFREGRRRRGNLRSLECSRRKDGGTTTSNTLS